jgi:hypothetical protein
MLWLENVNSFTAIYGMPVCSAEEHAEHLRAISAYRYEPLAAKGAAVAKIARCYDNQSCEHDGWETSRAKRVVDLIAAAFPESLPGYEAMPWGVSSEADLAKARV